jgi:nucleoside-diphosphate-sugar epimerase
MPRSRVLVTGLSGLIGGAVREHVGGAWDLVGLNRRPVPSVPCHQADIAHLEAILPAFAGAEVVVHLAALADSNAPFPDIERANVLGTYNVFEAARRAGARRVVYASSGATVSGWERDMPYAALVAGRYDEVREWRRITPDMPARPTALYGVSKVWGEALARHWADAYGLSMIGLRIGHVVAEDKPLAPRDFSVWCSRRDIARAIERAVGAPADLRFATVFVNSDNRWGYRDLEPTRRALGWTPLDRAEDHR